jgi:hypothetical protein
MTEHANTFLLLTILGLVTILLIFGMKYFSVGRQARMRLANEGAYRELAERGAAAQAASATSSRSTFSMASNLIFTSTTSA